MCLHPGSQIDDFSVFPQPHAKVADTLCVLLQNAGHLVDKEELMRSVHSIAVLPLENLSGDASQDYFADGMTDELISNLDKSVHYASFRAPPA
jgi:hypothetical protein